MPRLLVRQSASIDGHWLAASEGGPRVEFVLLAFLPPAFMVLEFITGDKIPPDRGLG